MAKNDKPKKAKGYLPMLPSLSFDSSGSAQVRFVGKLAHVNVHWAKFGSKIAQAKLVCPEDEDADLVENKHSKACKACLAGTTKKPRGVAIGWDVASSRWCVFMAAPSVFHDVFAKGLAHGITAASMEAGNGANVIIQRVGMSTVVEVVPESIGSRPQGDDEVPELGLVLAGMRKRSLWTKYAKPDDIPIPDESASSANESGSFLGSNTTGLSMLTSFSTTAAPVTLGLPGSWNAPLAWNVTTSPPPDPPIQPQTPEMDALEDFSPEPPLLPRNKDGKWLDGSSLIVRSRWEMMG